MEQALREWVAYAGHLEHTALDAAHYYHDMGVKYSTKAEKGGWPKIKWMELLSWGYAFRWISQHLLQVMGDALTRRPK